MAQRGNGNNSRGRGRGQPSGRGGRGWRGPSTPRGGRGGSWRGGPKNYNNLDVIDVDIQQYTNESSRNASPAPPNRGQFSGRARGRGRGRVQNFMTFRNNGRPVPPRPLDTDGRTPDGRTERKVSRGLGMKYTEKMSLSTMLALDRPYLRPIQFVPAQLTPVLFQEKEELIQVEEFIEPEDHVPTAAQVTRVFSGQTPQDSFFHNPEDDILGDEDSEPIVTIDFNSIGTFVDEHSRSTKIELGQRETGPSILNEVMAAMVESKEDSVAANMSVPNGHEIEEDATTAETTKEASSITIATDPHISVEMSETISTRITTNSKEALHIDLMNVSQSDSRSIKHSDSPTFIIDPNPATQAEPREEHLMPATVSNQALGLQLPDEEVIVYDAPNPRSGRSTPNIAPAHGAENTRLGPSISAPIASSSKVPDSKTFHMMDFSFAGMSKAAETNRERNATPRSRRLTKKDRQVARRSKRFKRSSFGMAGAMLEEMHIHDEDSDEMKGSRRQGSDIEWGVEDGDDVPEVDSELERVSSGLGGMTIDSDVNVKSMQSFVKSMSSEGMVYARIDDLDDEDEDDSGGNDSELDAMMAAEEELLVGEADGVEAMGLDDDDDDDDDDESSDDAGSPNRSFQARLEKVRLVARGKQKEDGNAVKPLFQSRMLKLRQAKMADCMEAPDSEEDDFDESYTKAEETEDFFADLQDILDENDDILSGRDRKQKKVMFNAIRDGEFPLTPAKKKRDYGKGLPPDLREQWEKDREKKAENKAKRTAARLAAALDPQTQLRSGKKAQKSMLRAGRLAEQAEAALEGLSKRAIDVPALVADIRDFIAASGGTNELALPPMDKASRKVVHEVAACFELTSKSKGKNDARFITLHKRARAGAHVKEHKLARILREWGGVSFVGSGKPGGARRGGGGAPRHREGDEVGKEAPKIGESNIGFKMLAGMGWAEGERIGVSGGLEVPLTAIIKNTKLGLGATRA